MPLARIDLPESVEPSRRSLIGDIVYQTLVDVLNAPTGDKFQIITAHDSDSLRIDPSYLGIDRSAAAFTIDITLLRHSRGSAQHPGGRAARRCTDRPHRGGKGELVLWQR